MTLEDVGREIEFAIKEYGTSSNVIYSVFTNSKNKITSARFAGYSSDRKSYIDICVRDKRVVAFEEIDYLRYKELISNFTLH